MSLRDWWDAIKELVKKPDSKPWLPPRSWPADKPLPPPPEKKK